MKDRIRFLLPQPIRHLEDRRQQRMPANNCEHSSIVISHRAADRLTCEFLTDRFPCDAE